MATKRPSPSINRLRKLQEQWFADGTPMCKVIDEAIRELKDCKWEVGWLRCENRILEKRLEKVGEEVRGHV